ncbi:MAG: hypothetical protein Q9226_008597, partial [Calogaya cf. arnoldii]
TFVASERPGLPGCGCIEGDVAGDNEDKNDVGEAVYAGCGKDVAEHVDEGVGGRVVEGVSDGGDGEEVGGEENEAHGCVEEVAPHHGDGDAAACVFNFFGHMCGGVATWSFGSALDVSGSDEEIIW